MPSQLHAQIGEYHIARRGLEPVSDILAQALQQHAAASHKHSRAVMVPWRKAPRARKDKPMGALDSMAFKKAKTKANLIRPW